MTMATSRSGSIERAIDHLIKGTEVEFESVEGLSGARVRASTDVDKSHNCSITGSLSGIHVSYVLSGFDQGHQPAP
ncbi:MAG: hypothetical protein ACI9HA_002574, partial [Dinoroseobacter sp.]